MPGFLSVAAPGKTASCHTIKQENSRCRLKVGFVLVGFFVGGGFSWFFLLLLFCFLVCIFKHPYKVIDECLFWFLESLLFKKILGFNDFLVAWDLE